MKKTNKKQMKSVLKKTVALAGIAALVTNLILFSFHKIGMKTFFITIGFFWILVFLFYKKT